MSRRPLRLACVLALAALAAQGQIVRSGPNTHDRRAATKAYLAGARAIERRDARAAYDSFSQAASLDPTNRDYQNAVAVAKAHFVTDLVQQAEKARIPGKNDVSRARLAEANELDPQNPIVAQHISELADLSSTASPSDDLSSQMADAIRLAPSPGVHSFHLRADGQSLLRQALSAYGITPSFDSSVTTQSLRFDVDDVDYKQAEQMLQLETNTFFVPLDPHRVLVAKDTRENRATYERLMLETIYLPGLTAQEATDVGNVARNILDIQQAAAQPSRERSPCAGRRASWPCSITPVRSARRPQPGPARSQNLRDRAHAHRQRRRAAAPAVQRLQPQLRDSVGAQRQSVPH